MCLPSISFADKQTKQSSQKGKCRRVLLQDQGGESLWNRLDGILLWLWGQGLGWTLFGPTSRLGGVLLGWVHLLTLLWWVFSSFYIFFFVSTCIGYHASLALVRSQIYVVNALFIRAKAFNLLWWVVSKLRQQDQCGVSKKIEKLKWFPCYLPSLPFLFPWIFFLDPRCANAPKSTILFYWKVWWSSEGFGWESVASGHQNKSLEWVMHWGWWCHIPGGLVVWRLLLFPTCHPWWRDRARFMCAKWGMVTVACCVWYGRLHRFVMVHGSSVRHIF